jgi:hypothetical protein
MGKEPKREKSVTVRRNKKKPGVERGKGQGVRRSS